MTCAYVEARSFVIDSMRKNPLFKQAGCSREDCDLILAAVQDALAENFIKLVSTDDPLKRTIQC